MGKILAKSPINDQEVTLSKHATAVRDAVNYLFGTIGRPTRLGSEWLRFFRLGTCDFHKFLVNLQLAALFHDLGKANDGFQSSIRRQGNQVIRHEHLSALLLFLEPMRVWLSGHHDVDMDIIVSAVVSHHLKVNDKGFAKRLVDGRESINVFTQAPEFTECLQMASKIMNTDIPDISGFDRKWYFEKDIDPMKGPDGDFGRSMNHFKDAILGDNALHRLLVSVKAALIASDSAGSALVREGLSINEWLKKCFVDNPLTSQEIERKIIQPRIQEIEKKTGRKFKWYDFQKASARLGNRALLLSGCGTGKTLAAWNWIKAQTGHRPPSHVIFLYPTRGTATEGFRDYASWAGGEDAALLHGTASYDLQGVFDNPVDGRCGGDYLVNERLFALAYWPKRVFSATVDSFLAFMRNQYASLCLLPVLADSVIVVDEVHSFDQAMFTALERFLKFFDIPVLCMTASLPSDRLKILKDTPSLKVFPQDTRIFKDLERQSKAPRYKISLIKEEKAIGFARKAIMSDKKVLWVVNTVSRCQEKVELLRRDIPKGKGAVLFCYHSRFKLSDRRERHNKVIQEFHKGTIVIATQVCEMSLDMDADVLITELAPVPSMIQRMGRCCRKPLPDSQGEVYLYEPRDEKPYERPEIEEGKRFAEEMRKKQKARSHADLSNYLGNKMVVNDPFPKGGYTGFLDAGAYAMSKDESFRETDDFTVDCVLDSDIEEFLEMRKNGNPGADGYIVPVPRRFAQEDTRLGRYLRKAPAKQYDAEIGFKEARDEKK